MSKSVNLLDGSIVGSLSRLAFPIMGASLIQMGYNLIDMIWIGRLGSGAVAAVGAAGMFLWMANGVTTVPRIGGQVTVGRSWVLATIKRRQNMLLVHFEWDCFLV